MDESEARDNQASAPAPTADASESSSTGIPESWEPTFSHSFNESFECCVCLDLLYKPIVLVCGHISCFWCVHRAMDGFMESHCPMCRQPYKHFPAICQLLHNLLWKIEPAAYKRRKKEVLEIESKQNCFSPQFVEHFTEDTVHTCTNLLEQISSNFMDAPLESGSVCEGNSKVQYVMDDLNADGHVTLEYEKSLEDGLENGVSQYLCVSDALCARCKQLLFQPAVLNCGHVYCEPCLLGLGSETPRCQVCQSVQPGDLPKVCLQLSSFLENKFPKEYAQRRESFQGLSSLSGGRQANKREAQFDKHKRALSMEDMLKTHVHVGCDSCGMYPIVGRRYRCKDCKESIGFDLCEACYETRSKLPARFNQQHTPDHAFVLDETRTFARLFDGALRHDFDEDFSGDSTETEIPDSTA